MVDVVSPSTYCDYMDVGVRELKAKLSEYIGRASAGETVIVTDRGRPVAQLAPLDGVSPLERGVEEGWVTPPARVRLEDVEATTGRMSVIDALDDDRG